MQVKKDIIESCSIFVNFFHPSETKFTLLNHRRKSDYIECLFTILISTIFNNKNLNASNYELMQLARQVQDDYLNLLLTEIQKGHKKEKIANKINNIASKIRQHRPGITTLEKMEELIRGVDTSKSVDFKKLCHSQKTVNKTKLQTNKQKIIETLQNFVDAYYKYSQLKKRFENQGSLHSPRPFMIEFLCFFTHYSFALLVHTECATLRYQTFPEYIVDNLDRAEKHLHRAVLDIYKVIVVVLHSNEELTWKGVKEVICARQEEINTTSGNLDERIAKYKNICKKYCKKG
jgi:hypothetical protein